MLFYINMEKYQYITLNDIQTNPYQPRKEFSEEKITELANSIKEHGIIQPIIVRKSPIIGYELLAGERRFRAAKLAGLTNIPAIIKEVTDDEMMKQAIIENLQREDLNPIEEAQSYQYLIDKGLTHKEIALTMGKSRPYITNSVRLLNLPLNIIEAIKEGNISQGHARLLINLSEKEQNQWFDKILSQGLSVRQLEKQLHSQQTKTVTKNKHHLFLKEEEKRLKKIFGTEISLQFSEQSQSGKICIHFSNLEEYQRIIDSFK